jgi:hypothetical protein
MILSYFEDFKSVNKNFSLTNFPSTQSIFIINSRWERKKRVQFTLDYKPITQLFSINGRKPRKEWIRTSWGQFATSWVLVPSYKHSIHVDTTIGSYQQALFFSTITSDFQTTCKINLNVYFIFQILKFKTHKK